MLWWRGTQEKEETGQEYEEVEMKYHMKEENDCLMVKRK